MHVELAASAPASLPPPEAPPDPLLLALLADPELLLLPPLLLLDPIPLPEPVPLLLPNSLPLLLDPVPLPEPTPPVLDAPPRMPLLEPPMLPELLLVPVPVAPLVVFNESPGSAAQAKPRQIVVPRRRMAGAERRCMGKRPKLSASSRGGARAPERQAFAPASLRVAHFLRFPPGAPLGARESCAMAAAGRVLDSQPLPRARPEEGHPWIDVSPESGS